MLSGEEEAGFVLEKGTHFPIIEDVVLTMSNSSQHLQSDLQS